MRISTEKGDCPECGDDSFSPSRAHGFEILFKVLTPYSPFRCTICNTRFWASTGLRGYISNVLYVCVFIALLALLFSQKLFDDSSRSALQESNALSVKAKTEIGSAISDAIKLEQELKLELNGSTETTERNTLKAEAVSPPVVKTSSPPVSPPPANNAKVTQRIAAVNLPAKAEPVTLKTPVKPNQQVGAKVVANNKQQLRDTVLDQVENWRAAWENQDVARYLASYSVKFKPEKGIKNADWSKKRRATLLKPEWVKLSTRDLQTIFSNNNRRVIVTFEQDYAASNYADLTRKELVLILQGGNWNIIRERSL